VEAEVFDLAVGLARLASRLEGLAMRALVRLAELRPVPGPCLDGEGDEPFSPYLGDELAAELGQSPRTMAGRLDQAWDIAHRLPAALDALVAGDLDLTRLRALHALTHVLSDGQRAVVEAQMLAGSRLRSPTQWRRKIHRMIARLDPDALTRRCKEAKAKRDVTLEPAEDGMAVLRALLPAEDARAVFDLVDRIARGDAQHDGDRRPVGVRRADVLTALLLGNRRERVTVEIQVIAMVGTLAGLDENPAELVGYGPIPAEAGRALAADARWRRVLTDPETGTVLDLGHRRVPTPALARLVRHRDTRCVYPGCAMPAVVCDLDHTNAWVRGGHTAANNLNVLCRRHHVMKHSAGWQLEQPEAGVFIWTSPAGRRHLVDNTSNDEEGLLPDEDHRTWTTAPHPQHAHQPDRAAGHGDRLTRPRDPCPF
jgi:hypothetical protein